MNETSIIETTLETSPLWRSYRMAVDDVSRRLSQIASAFAAANVPYALIGGQAVALWVASKDPAAVRTTKDVDILLQRSDLPQARAAARTAGFDYFETMGVGMFLDQADPNPRHGVHICWASEKVRPEYELAAPAMDQRQSLGGLPVVALADLVLMKLQSNRDQDRVHLRDMIDVGLVDRALLTEMPSTIAAQLEALLVEQGH